MNIRTLAALAVLAALSLATTNASAQTHTDSFIYQGSLMDGGVPADGFYDIIFSVYDSDVGGALIPGGIEFVFNIEVVDGLFETFVDFGTTGAVFDSDQTRWLQLSVKEVGQVGSTVLAPRQRMAPTPLANYALRSGTSLQDAYNTGSSIFRGIGDPAVEIRSSSTLPASLNIGSTSGTEPHGQFFMYSPAGSNMFFVDRDFNGGGGFLALARNDAGSNGFIVDGNAVGSGSTEVSIFGISSSIVLSTRLTDDLSVQLPNNAINATEILNETGVTSVANSGIIILTDQSSTIDVFTSVTIDCPTAGFVFVIATTELRISHIIGTTSRVILGISDNTSAFPANGDLQTEIDNGIPSGIQDHAVTAHSVFPASAGLNTFYFLGDKITSGGFARVSDIQLSAIFIPTAYGSGVLAQAGPNLPDELSPVTGPLTNYDIVMEQNASLRANAERQQREIDEMRAQMQEILEQSQRNLDQQSQD